MKKPRRILALALILALTGGLLTMVAQPASSVASQAHIDISHETAAEGMVLVKNDGILPLKSDARVALFGSAQCRNGGSVPTNGWGTDGWLTYGGGSGAIKSPDGKSIDFQTGMLNMRAKGRLASVHTGGVGQRFAAVTTTQASTGRANADIAVVTLSHYCDESNDLPLEPNDRLIGYNLSANERTTLTNVCAQFSDVVVVMNIGNYMDMSWVVSYPNIKAVLIAWMPGMEGGNAAAEILCGVVNPSGKLASSFAKSWNDFGSSTGGDFNGGFLTGNDPIYYEDVYVGYRYLATKDPTFNNVVYEFGFGLSYSTFNITNKNVTVSGDDLVVTAKVTNMGPYAGKEVVQIYYEPPAGVINKPKYELAAFAKTKLLQPYQSQVVTMRFPLGNLACYDDVGKAVRAAWVLEAGDYNIYAGNSLKNAVQSVPAGVYNQAGLRVWEQLSNQLTAPAFNRLIDPVTGATQSTTYNGGQPISGPSNPLVGPATPIQKVSWPGGTVAGDSKIQLEDVYNEPGYIYDFVAQMTNSELSYMSEHKVPVYYTTYAPQGSTGILPRLGIPEVTFCDGPAGIKLGAWYEEPRAALAIPIGTLQACTWNEELIEQLGECIGREMEEQRVDIWLAPGMNIHRNPRCGRNFEYYSEDPLISGKTSAAVTRGVQRVGGLVSIKHFAANNQETGRYGGNSQISERALREIYLKGFEICVKEADPGTIMTSYNKINGTATESSTPLLKNILRNEWGFNGFLETDWWNGRASTLSCVTNGCNIRMDDRGSNFVNAGNRAMAEASVVEIIKVCLRTHAIRREFSPEPRISSILVSPSHVVQGQAATITVTVTGRNLAGATIRVGANGSFVTLPEVSNTGGSVNLAIPAYTSTGTFDVSATLNGVTSSVTGKLRVDPAGTQYVCLYVPSLAKYITIPPSDMAGIMTATLNAPDDYAEFKLTQTGANYTLLAYNGLYVCIEDTDVKARTASPAGWETFVFEDAGGGNIRIKRAGGAQYIGIRANGDLYNTSQANAALIRLEYR